MSSILNVLYIISTVDGYGADKSILANIIHLKNLGLVNPILIIFRHGKIEDFLRENKIRYHVIPFRNWFIGPSWFFSGGIKRIAKQIINLALAQVVFFITCRSNISIVHTNTFTSNFGIILAKRLRACHIMHIRELPIQQFSFDYERDQSYICSYVDKWSQAVIANSGYVKEYFQNLFHINNINILNNPIQTKHLEENINNYDFTAGIKIIAIGRLNLDKGFNIIIEAANILQKEGVVGFQIFIFGDGEMKNVLEEQIYSYNLDKVVIINPYCKNISSILSNYHIGLITSRHEAFGRAAVEFMISGLTVIGNETGNTPLLIENGVDGYIAKFDSPADYAISIKHLIANSDQIIKCGSAAFNKVNNKYTIDSSSLALHKIYTDVLKNSYGKKLWH